MWSIHLNFYATLGLLRFSYSYSSALVDIFQLTDEGQAQVPPNTPQTELISCGTRAARRCSSPASGIRHAESGRDV